MFDTTDKLYLLIISLSLIVLGALLLHSNFMVKTLLIANLRNEESKI
jgi:hypothetical protein